MDSIYQRAQRVTVWLWKGSPQLNHPNGPVSPVIRNADKAHESEINSIRNSLQELLRARWWSRVWVVQETALASGQKRAERRLMACAYNMPLATVNKARAWLRRGNHVFR